MSCKSTVLTTQKQGIRCWDVMVGFQVGPGKLDSGRIRVPKIQGLTTCGTCARVRWPGLSPAVLSVLRLHRSGRTECDSGCDTQGLQYYDLGLRSRALFAFPFLVFLTDTLSGGGPLFRENYGAIIAHT